MQIPAGAQQLIDINSQSPKTQSDIAIAVLAKQLNVAKQEGASIVDLIQPITSSSR